MAQLRRKFYDFLVAWKENKRQECLWVKGAIHVYYKNENGTGEVEFGLERDGSPVPDGYKFVGGNVAAGSAQALKFAISSWQRRSSAESAGKTWNYYSYAKWVYAVPWVHRWQIREMPLIGFAGCLPFGVECAAVTSWLCDAFDCKDDL